SSTIFKLLSHACFCSLALHDGLPISSARPARLPRPRSAAPERRRAFSPRQHRLAVTGSFAAAKPGRRRSLRPRGAARLSAAMARSEEHTSELQSRENLVCRLLLEKKK